MHFGILRTLNLGNSIKFHIFFFNFRFFFQSLFNILMLHKLFKLSFILLPSWWDNFRSFLFVFSARGESIIFVSLKLYSFLWRFTIVTEILINHVGIDIWIGINTTTISWIAETRVNMSFFDFSYISPFLDYISHLPSLLFSLKIFLFYVSNSILVLFS